ncbi:MAG: hypothetical protein ACRCU6_08840 [Fusobacteriaceae bacterium]
MEVLEVDRLEKMKEIKTQIIEVRDQVRIALENNNFNHATDCIADLEEMSLELKCLENFDEEAAQMVGGDF